MGEVYLSTLMTRLKVYYREKLALVKTEFSVGQCSDMLLSGDLERSVEVIQNMMENAIKYGDGKRISLEFSEEDGCALVTVRNSGCTMADAELPHMFDSFWRGSNAHKEKGSGLGLYICRQLMNKMNGEVFAQIQEQDMCVTAVFQKA
jgi:signal transduction histidine kinase